MPSSQSPKKIIPRFVRRFHFSLSKTQFLQVKGYPLLSKAHLFPGDLLDVSKPESRPFEKLHVRIRPLVVDEMETDQLDMTNTGKALDPDDWHDFIQNENEKGSSTP